MAAKILTQARLKELMAYDPETGVFVRIKDIKRGGAKAGDIPGYYDAHRYRILTVDGQQHKAHRLAFLYMTGNLPIDEVDHINRVKDDNSWANLRNSSRRENVINTGLSKNNNSGHTGVGLHRGRWRARICVERRSISLGYHDTKDGAIEARKEAEKKYGYVVGQSQAKGGIDL